MHKHFWILDKHSFGRCKCGATQQFPVEEIIKLNMHRPPRYDPDSWLSASLHGVKIKEVTDKV